MAIILRDDQLEQRIEAERKRRKYATQVRAMRECLVEHFARQDAKAEVGSRSSRRRPRPAAAAS